MTWTDYFPFETDDELEIEARVFFYSVPGTGKVVEVTDNILDFNWRIPEQTGRISIPEMRGSMRIEYVRDGVGNRGVVTLNSETVEDDNINISSRPRHNRRRIDPSKDVNGEDLAFTLRRRGRSRAEIVDITGVNAPSGLRIEIYRA